MKTNKIFIHFVFILYLFSLFIYCEEIETSQNISEQENLEENKYIEEESSEEKKEKEKENDIDDPDAGFFISDKVFDEKLQKILEEKNLNLKPKKKITKQQLRLFFEIIYKTEHKEGDIKPEEIDPEINPEEHSKQFMDSIFNEATKSLDYDDKIRVKEIKEWINPTRVQKAYLELLQGLSENIDYL
jgi:hypothetical protein